MRKIVFFYPKPRLYPNYSIPGLFSAIQHCLSSRFKTEAIVSSYHSSGIWKRFFISLEARNKQGDINHVTGDVHFIACLLKKKRTVLTIHDCGFMNHSSAIARFILKWFWLRLPVWRSAAVTVVSDATKKEVLKYVNCKPEKIRVIPNFISANFRSCPKSFNSAKPVILHIGTAPNKNLERVIKAIAAIPCRLHVIGKLSTQQLSLLNEYCIDYTNVYNVNEEAILKAYYQCDMLVFASTAEGFGLPILEAQAVGRPVVTSNVSAMPEVAGNAACFVNPCDVSAMSQGIQKVISDAEYREDLIEKGFLNVPRFSMAATVEGYHKLYTAVLTGKRY